MRKVFATLEEFRKFETKLGLAMPDLLYDPTKFSIATGDDAVLDDIFSYQIYNKIKNHWYAASEPSDKQAGMIWIDSDDDIARRYDGAAWARIGMADIVEDLTPQLGGDLDLNGKNIDFPSTPNISDVKDEDDMASNSAVMLATQQSIKAYVDSFNLFKAGNFTRDLAAASGDVEYTGLGFSPKVVIFYLCDETTSTTFASWGFDDGTNHRVIFTPAGFGSVFVEETISLYGQQGATDHQQAFIKTLLADGFELTWTKTGNPAGTLHINFLAFR